MMLIKAGLAPFATARVRAVSRPARLLTMLAAMALGTAGAAVASRRYLPRRLRRALDVVMMSDTLEVGPALQRFSQELAALHEREAIVNLLLDGLVETLHLTAIAFVALPEGLDQRMLRLIEADDLRVRRGYEPATQRQVVLRGLAALDLTTRRLSWDAPLLLDPWPGCAALVLIAPAHDVEGMALLVIGPKRGGGRLTADDQALLVTVAHQAATALANAVLVAGLTTSLAQVQISTAQLVAARAEQQLLLRELVNADERQRAALARDLHDDALQEALYLIRHSRLCSELATTLERATDGSGAGQAEARTPTLERLRQELTQLTERSAVVERKLRALCMGLYPALLPSLGLPAALDDLVKELEAASGISISLHYDDEVLAAASRLSSEAALHIYRIAQEALRNVGKHARTTSAEVRLRYEPGQAERGTRRAAAHDLLRLEVSDDGPGVPLPIDYVGLLRQGHLGLAGMRDRAERLGGELRISPASPRGGTRVTLVAPLEPLEPLEPLATPVVPPAHVAGD
jgi:signal transduction histidine kinase